MKTEKTYIAKNRKAFHDYFVEDRIEAGIELTGTEVCSLRENSAQLRDCFIVIRRGEAWLNGVHISPYSHGSIFNVDPERRRRLLLHKKEILKLQQQADRKGYSLIPLSMYFNPKGRVKVEVGVCRGKKTYDKRASIKERDTKREIDRALKSRNR
ncbi:MAG: SsrA-binding protein SmpB [Coriobacteriales bacterium]|nr:SsrA-binding protein SmpB [Coriobacteriaceae bacterium]MDY5662417.1 SsrA-binding protein SmpB [Coriobacteriales bacterium]